MNGGIWNVRSIVSWGPLNFDSMHDTWFAMQSSVAKEKERTPGVARWLWRGMMGLLSVTMSEWQARTLTATAEVYSVPKRATEFLWAILGIYTTYMP